MAQLGVAGGGAAVGAVIGSLIPGVGTMLGAQIGWAIGGVAGALLFPPKGPDQYGPRLNELTVQTSGYGVPIAVVAGQAKLAGNVIWKQDIRETVRRRRIGKGGRASVETTYRWLKTIPARHQGGKGGARQTTTTYTYSLSWAVGICEWLIPPTSAGLLRIWLDNKLVFDVTGQNEITKVPGLTFRFYDGNESQLPDPIIEAKEGAGNAPAHRGLCYLVFEDVPLEIFGNRMPNVTVEISSSVEQSFPQINSIPPASPLYPSSPSSRTYISNWPCNVAVDYARGRIYEGRSRTSGATGSANDELIRVYDLISMETIGEYPMGDMVETFFPIGTSPTTASVGAGLLHLGQDGYLYATGGSDNRVPLWKIDPDTWRAVGVFGPPGGAGLGFGDNGTRLVNPMAITSISVPRLGAKPRTFVIVQGSYSSTLTIDADRMEYVWGAGDVALEPPPVPIGLGISPLTFPVILVPGRTRDDGGVELWVLRASELATPFRIDVARFRYYSGAASLGGGAAMGIFRDDFAAIDVQAEIDPLNVRPLLQAAFWDASDDTLVITLSGTGGPLSGWGRFSTIKWSPGGGVVWKVVDHVLPASHDGRGQITRVLGGTWGLGGNFVVQPGAGSVLVNATGADFNTLSWVDEAQAVIGYRSGGVGAKEIAKRYLLRSSPVVLTVGQVVTALCQRGGLTISDINVSELGDSIRGYMLPRPMSAREAITPLAATYQFDAAEIDDVLVFRKRAGPVVESIEFNDLVRESADGTVIEEQRAQDQELPREVTVRFADIERGWEQNAQSWRRPANPTATMGSVAATAMDLPIPLTATEGKTIAKRMCIAIWRERTKLEVSLGPQFLRVVPTDPITIETRDGATIRCRVLSTQLGANWTTRLEAVTEDAAVYDLSAEGDGGDGWDEPRMPLPYYTRLMLPDLALVGDGDDMGQSALREYAFLGAYDGARWRGVQVVRSADFLSWEGLGASTTPSVWGSVLETPAVPFSPWIWDDANEILVRLTDGELESATALEVLNGANMAALVSPSGEAEIIQFRDAEDLGGGEYRLTGLLRGRRGTEDQTAARRAGDLFLLLDDRLPFSAGVSEASAARYHRAVNIYQTIETAAPTTTKTARGRAEKPYAPAQIAGTRDGSDNLSLTWARRTRVGGEWLNGTGTVALSEASEAYEVVILDGSSPVARGYTSNGGTAAAAFDGAIGAGWSVLSFFLPLWVACTFAGGKTIVQYGIRAQGAFAATDTPRAFSLEGWNGAAWQTLDSRTAETGWSNSELRKFTIAAPGNYLTYRLTVTTSNGGGNTTLAELELYERVGGPNIAAADYAPNEVRVIATTTPAATYSAADQTADFGAPMPVVDVQVYQMSNIVGRGIAAEVKV